MIDFRDLDLAGAIGAHYNDGLEAVTRIVKLRLGAAAWAAFSPEEKQRFNRQICVHYRIYGTSRYAAERIDQLLAGNFGFWVLHHCSDTCEERFAELDGIAVPPSDPFLVDLLPTSSPRLWLQR